ncbi:MAG: hypothetical protein U0401_14645 [Anaerolineae bacterium]
MNHTDKWFFTTLTAALILLFGAMMLCLRSTGCSPVRHVGLVLQNCHETQGMDSVANKGDWHKVHAFGDFCEFCHAGNVQAAAQDEAHVGMVAPLGDVKASCQGCHPSDYDKLAQTYASTLGVDLTTGGGGGAKPAAGSAPGGDSSCTNGATAVSAPLGGEKIDFNLLYAQAATPPPLISNWGNIILVLLILGVAAAFFVTAWSWENWGQTTAAWINHNIAPIPQAVTAAAGRSDSSQTLSQAIAADNPMQVQTLLTQKPELRGLLPKLVNLSPETLAALDSILSNPQRGSDLLQSVSQVDTEVIATLRQLGAKDWGLLKALFKE